jgi:hypothetical protein
MVKWSSRQKEVALGPEVLLAEIYGYAGLRHNSFVVNPPAAVRSDEEAAITVQDSGVIGDLPRKHCLSDFCIGVQVPYGQMAVLVQTCRPQWIGQ